jgi:GcrA cell cycle regulator
MSWTDERVEILRNMWLEGRSASQISAVLGSGLTRNAVIGKVHRLGLAGRVKPGTEPNESLAAPQRAQAAPRRASVSAPPPRGAAPTVMASTPMTQGATALAMEAEPQAQLQIARVEEDVVVPMSLRVTIVDLKEAMCKWPLGDPTSPDFRYCGSATTGAGPYCQHHAKLAYQPAQDRRRDRDRERRAVLLGR